MHQFITGKAPAQPEIVAEQDVTLDGMVSGVEGQNGGFPTNLPLKGAQVEVYTVDANTGIRTSQTPVHSQRTGTNGRWGGFQASGSQTYEFVISASGYPPITSTAAPSRAAATSSTFRLQRIVHADPGRPGHRQSMNAPARLLRPAPRHHVVRPRRPAARHPLSGRRRVDVAHEVRQ